MQKKLGRNSRRPLKAVVSLRLSSRRLNTLGSPHSSCDGPRRPTLRPGKARCFMGGPVLKEHEGTVSPILCYYPTVIVNRDTMFSVATIASYFISAPTKNQTRQLDCLDASFLLHTHRHIYATERGRSCRCGSCCRACRRGREQVNQRGTHRPTSGEGSGVLT